jgi:hypothetical protein
MSLCSKACLTAIAPVVFMLTAAFALSTAPRLAYADAAQQQSFTAWSQMADCARAAQKQFPDHTPDSNTKRENARQNCLRLRHLPVTPAPPQVGNGH